MYLSAKLIYQISDFERHLFEVTLLDRGIVLDVFLCQTRKTKRHKWNSTKRWFRLSARDSNCERPALTETVMRDGLKAIQDLVVWKETA